MSPLEEPPEVDEMAALGHNSLADLYVDAEAMRDEYERRGGVYAEANFGYDLLNDTLPSLLADITLSLKEARGIKSLAQAEMMAKRSSQYKNQIYARAAARKAMIVAKFGADAHKMYTEFVRSNMTTHREMAKIR